MSCRRCTLFLALLLALPLLGCAGPASSAQAPHAKKESPPKKTLSPLEKARAALKKGEFERAETLLQRALQNDPREATLVLGDLYLMTGRYARVRQLLGETNSAPADLIVAESLRREGKLDEARARLTEARPDVSLVEDLSRVVMRGAIQVELGQRDQAETILLRVISAANEGQCDELPIRSRARCWGLVGRAAHLLRSPEDANDAFNESESLAGADLDLLLARADLFIEKFDFAHAEQVLADAEKTAPHHPEVRLLRADLAVTAALAFSEAEEIAREVLETNPKSTGAFFILAGVALRDLNIQAAEQYLERGLSVNPRDLDLLSMKAAVRFLAEDPAGFEAVVDQVLDLSPGYSELFRVVGTYAEWEHRYPDIERLMRRAVRLDREDGRARSLLGLTLVRSGSDAAGVVELRSAFDLDPYNVRVLNTLNLYEKTIPEEYVELRQGPFAYRFPKDEAPLLQRYVPPLLEDAYEQMADRYGYEPTAPIGIEIYASRDQFAVRTSGLPQTAIAGVCFGRKLATVSPIGAPGNLGMTLWHELAHVFHIGLSQNRVPRWLTEGLAEWETAHRQVGWSREMDLELYRALVDDQLPQLGSMSRAFTHARHMADIANAYYASGRIAAWIVESWGVEKARSVLAEFGNKKLPHEVVPPVLGASFPQLDEQFRAYIRKDLQRFDSQFVSDEPFVEQATVERLLEENPRDEKARFLRALIHLSDGQLEEAEALLADLLKESFDPQVVFARARVLFAQDKEVEARALLEQMIEADHDGYEVRMILGRIHLSRSSHEEAVRHLRQATKLNPPSEEAWSMLAAIYHQTGDQSAELEALKKWSRLSEHEPMVHRRLVTLLIEQERYQEAKAVAELGIWADLAGFEMHRLFGLAMARLGDLEGAEFEFESALLCPARPQDILELAQTWRSELKRLGRPARAKRVAEIISKLPQFGGGSSQFDEAFSP